MVRRYPYDRLGRGRHGWLNRHYHFSHGEYVNPKRENLGPLLVVNDDMLHPNNGFSRHEHRDVEILSYVVSGELKHIDDDGNENLLKRGEMFHMSCGTGLSHSELNNDSKNILRYFEIWIQPDKKDLKPNFGIAKFKWMERINHWFLIAGPKSSNAPIQINQDLHFYSSYLIDPLTFEVGVGRVVYLVLIEGELIINDVIIEHGDAIEFDESLIIKPTTFAHVIAFEMAKEREKVK